jgi:transcriptional regulator with XRE-family HTH domain
VPEPLSQRRYLGMELRRLRDLAGLSTRELAPKVGISPAGVTRTESGSRVPTLPEVNAWATATRASDEVKDRLVALTESAYNEVQTWRGVLSGARHLQQRSAAMEAVANLERDYDPVMLPGLLQTAGYARRILELCAVPGQDIPAATTARLERQQVLYETPRRFEFLITETALRWPVASESVMRAQLNRITSVAGMDNVNVAVLPAQRGAARIGWHGFTIYEEIQDGGDPFVYVELVHADVTISDPPGVAAYQHLFGQLKDAALTGDAAAEFIATIARPSTELR